MDGVAVGVRALREADLRAGNVQETVGLAAYKPARFLGADNVIGRRHHGHDVLGFGPQRGEGTDEV